MDTLMFLIVLGCLAFVGLWYLVNEARGAGGLWGLLAVRSNAGEESAETRYRRKTRGGPPERITRNQPRAAESYAPKKQGGRFLDKDTPGYSQKGPAPGYGEKQRTRPKPDGE